MGRGARAGMTSDDPSHEAPHDPRPPSMFRRPTDVPEALPPIRGSELLSILHTKWIDLQPPAEVPSTSPWHRLLRRSRRVGARVMRRGDHDLLGDLIRAVDAIAGRCDELGRAHRDDRHERRRHGAYLRGGHRPGPGRPRTAAGGQAGTRGPRQAMGEPSPPVSTLVLSRHWRRTNSEISFVTRSLAGAASRFGRITDLRP